MLLGNLNAKRDWGYAPEYVEGMWRMLQQDKPSDYVLATGETHTVREFTYMAFKELGIELEWKGENEHEKGIEKNTGKEIIIVDPFYFRPTEIDILLGDPTKAKENLGWEPKIKFQELVKIMTLADWEKVKKRGY